MAYEEVINALADPTRRRVFEALRARPMSVRDLAAGETVSRPAVSQHLKVLERARLVDVRPEGNRRIYAIRREGLDELRRYVDSFWTEVLGAYGAEIRRRQSSN